jgi:hypothetical protein
MPPNHPFSPPKTTKDCAHCGIAFASIRCGKKSREPCFADLSRLTEGVNLDLSLSRENAIAFDHISLYKEFCGEQAFRRGR